jgi:hypothetical protein
MYVVSSLPTYFIGSLHKYSADRFIFITENHKTESRVNGNLPLSKNIFGIENKHSENQNNVKSDTRELFMPE